MLVVCFSYRAFNPENIARTETHSYPNEPYNSHSYVELNALPVVLYRQIIVTLLRKCIFKFRSLTVQRSTVYVDFVREAAGTKYRHPKKGMVTYSMYLMYIDKC